MNVLEGIKGLFGSGSESIIKDIGDIAARYLPGAQEKAKFEEQVANALRAHEEKLTEMANADLNSAREMQKTALLQEDKFSKRFLYYLAIGTVGISFIIIILMFFIAIPKGNERIIDISIGILLGSGLAQVFAFFFGSSQSSKDKTAIIKDLSK